jgi:hypothetical protein
MYKYLTLPEIIKTTEAAVTKPIERHGIGVYIDSSPGDVSPDVYIDPLDTKGIAIAREFFAKILEHQKTLDNGQGTQAAV